MREAEVLLPSEMIALGDADLLWDLGGIHAAGWSGRANSRLWKAGTFAVGGGWISKKTYVDGFYRKGEDLQRQEKALDRRHGGRQNIWFCDGHIETSRWRIIHQQTDQIFRRWNINHEPVP